MKNHRKVDLSPLITLIVNLRLMKKQKHLNLLEVCEKTIFHRLIQIGEEKSIRLNHPNEVIVSLQ